MRYNEKGEELPDPTEVEVPLGLRRPPSLQEQIKAMVRSEISRRAAAQGFETFEEADDFDIPDDDELVIDSPHEMTEEQELADASDLERPRGSAVRGGLEEPVSGAAGGGVVRQEEGRSDVQGGASGGGASAVRSVESAAKVRAGGSG